MLKAVTVVLIIFTTNTYAMSVYKCKEGDKVVFSQMPCDNDNTDNKKLDYSEPRNVVVTAPYNSSQASESISNTSSYIHQQKKRRTEAEIMRLTKKKNNEISALKKKHGVKPGVNRARKSYFEVINAEITATRDKYDKLIDKEKNNL